MGTLETVYSQMSVKETTPNTEFMKGLLPSLEAGCYSRRRQWVWRAFPSRLVLIFLRTRACAMHNLLVDVHVEEGGDMPRVWSHLPDSQRYSQSHARGGGREVEIKNAACIAVSMCTLV